MVLIFLEIISNSKSFGLTVTIAEMLLKCSEKAYTSRYVVYIFENPFLFSSFLCLYWFVWLLQIDKTAHRK